MDLVLFTSQFVVVWCIWLERNAPISISQVLPLEFIWDQVDDLASLWCSAFFFWYVGEVGGLSLVDLKRD